MGYRINKVIGYGVLDTKALGINAERIHDRFVPWSHSSVLEFWHWARQNADKIETNLPRTWRNASEECKFNNDVALHWKTAPTCDHVLTQGANWLVISDPSSDDWFRHDSIIDWSESKGVEDVVTSLDCTGIFPYNGVMGCVQPPSNEAKSSFEIQAGAFHSLLGLGCDDSSLMDAAVYNKLVGRFAKGHAPAASGAWLEHLLNDWAPPLPFGVLAAAVRLGLTDRELKHFRPITATFWR